ncbi:DNA polymerase III subunit beta [Falsiporphyromonas endometrii]|uniref:Beta sliding clamp n=1 Tax=Falsiporphyromonas endometrii TaxID=1387297 RepID=A0ABV9K5I9_9PORP
MRFEVSSSTIQQLIQTVSKVIVPKSNIPILECVLFEVKGNYLTITGADPGMRLEATIEINNLSGEDGRFAVLQRVLLDPIKEMPEQPITFTVNYVEGAKEYESQIDYQSGKYTFLASPADAYPEAFSLGQEPQTIMIKASDLMMAINATLYATSNDDRRPIMTGIYCDLFTDKVVFVGSDARMLVRHQNTNVHADCNAGFSMPKKVATMLSRSLLAHEDDDLMVKMSFSSKVIRVELPSFVLTALLVEGKFPNYNSVIPTSGPFMVTVDRQLLLSAARRISVFASESTNMLKFDFGPDGILLSANDLDFSVAAQEHVKADCPADINLKTGFESKAFQSALTAITSSEIKLYLTDQTRACVIEPCDYPEYIDQCTLILPMKII